jgi:glutathione synthase/RimK-type ligase-like ATP-grasp enzyme
LDGACSDTDGLTIDRSAHFAAQAFAVDTVKEILILVSSPQKDPGHLNWLGFRDLVADQIGDDIAVEMSALGQLTLLVNGNKTSIRDDVRGYDVADFDLVVFRTIGNRLQTAIAVAAYCRKKGIRYIDQYIPTLGSTKLAWTFVHWEHDLPVPVTASCPAARVKEMVKETGLPAVLKATGAMRGQNNYLVHSVDDIVAHMSAPDAPKYILQNFIPNDGDYRILVLNNKPVMAIKRVAVKGSHLNNTSQGGTASRVALDAMPSEALDVAVRATRLAKLAVAGADIIVDNQTGKPYLLEVNKEPQIATGGLAGEKTHFYVRALSEMVNAELRL